ncbi:hypothetical protein B0H12DRAFT_788110 [Mycena haematopus]|nr:hypothetical protein B0H12DRAFT_788110 [Mycena haematopus]
MGDEVPTKRRRTDSAAHPVETPLVRSTEYWFDDGNIILQVESMQFRVAKSILSRHSPVFRAMFMLPLPADEPTVENCPIVILTGDTSQDWSLFLGVIYPQSLTDEVPSLALIAAILRLSKKYDFPAFRKDCVRRLKTEFPTTLKEYNILKSWVSIEEEEDIYLRLLPFAKEIGLYSILPLAYWDTLMTRTTYLPKILDINDGSLNPNDRLACLLGISKLQVLQSTTTMGWLDLDPDSASAIIPCGTCSQPPKCVAAVKEIVCEEASMHPPYFWAISKWDKDWDKMMCRSCRSKAREVFEAGRKECWNKLPSVFGLPDWETLKSMDFE